MLLTWSAWVRTAAAAGFAAGNGGFKAVDRALVVQSASGDAAAHSGLVREHFKDGLGVGGKLVDFAQELEEGDTVVVDYRRGRETHRATIVAKELGSEGFSYAFTTPDVKIRTAPMIATLEGLKGALVWSTGWFDLELVKLNRDLGEYFGTTDGLLVIRAPEDSEFQLKGGDVILSVDGRPATGQAQLMRILGSYEAGEDVKIDVMRQKRRTTLTVRIPEERTPRPGRYEHQWDFDWSNR